jgi:dipeptidase E
MLEQLGVSSMKNLVLYSDQIPPLADEVDKELITLLGKPNLRIGYIPSSADPQRNYYKERQAYYSRMGMDLTVYFELDKEYRPNLLDLLLSCDGIHLSGGNTYYFLYWLHKRKMLEPLRQYVRLGGVLIGVSAGSILMSPDISICTLNVNEPIEVETDFSSLNLVDFAFAPHYKTMKMSTTISSLKKYSQDHQTVVYACQDSGGIVVSEDNVKCIGDVVKIDER